MAWISPNTVGLGNSLWGWWQFLGQLLGGLNKLFFPQLLRSTTFDRDDCWMGWTLFYVFDGKGRVQLLWTWSALKGNFSTASDLSHFKRETCKELSVSEVQFFRVWRTRRAEKKESSREKLLHSLGFWRSLLTPDPLISLLRFSSLVWQLNKFLEESCLHGAHVLFISFCSLVLPPSLPHMYLLLYRFLYWKAAT